MNQSDEADAGISNLVFDVNNYLNNKPNTAQQPRFNSLYSAAAKRYFATITLSPDELDSLGFSCP